MKKLALLDWKTGFVAPESRCQIGAYAHCPSLPQRPEIGCVVQVKESETKVAVRMGAPELEDAYRAFLSAKGVFDWMVKNDLSKVPKNEEYRIGGVYLPSVTYILGHAIAKPALMNWYFKMGKEGKDPNQIKQEAGERGAAFHRAIHTILQGKLVDTAGADDWLKLRVESFLRWKEKVSLEVVELEQKVWDEAQGYAGTLDCVAWISEDEALEPHLARAIERQKEEAKLAEWLDKEIA